MNRLSRSMTRWQYWLYRTGDLNLADAEQILKDSYGWIIGKYVGTRGRIALTDHRLIFVSDSARLVGPQQIRVSIELASIEDAATGSRLEFRGAVPGVTTFSVATHEDQCKFQTPDAAKLVTLNLERSPRALLTAGDRSVLEQAF